MALAKKTAPPKTPASSTAPSAETTTPSTDATQPAIAAESSPSPETEPAAPAADAAPAAEDAVTEDAPVSEADTEPAPATPPPPILGAPFAGIEAPGPLQQWGVADNTPPFPAQTQWPDGGNCVVIKPGEKLVVKAHRGRNGALVTDCRHYAAYLPMNSRRWSFRLIYAAGVEVYDRNVKVIEIATPETVQAAVLAPQE